MSDKVTRKSATGLDNIVFSSFLAVILVIVDQFIKKIVVTNMAYGEQKDVIKGFFSINYVRNTGSAFSLFADKAWGIYFLTAVSVVLGIVIFVFMIIAAKNRMPLLAFAFCLLSSGAFGNLVDRAVLRYVIDYLRFDFGAFTFPIFNFADICAVVGTFLLMFIIIFMSKYFEQFWNILFKKKKVSDAG